MIRTKNIILGIMLLFAVYGCDTPDNASELGLQPSFHAIIVNDIDTSIEWYSRALSYHLVDSTHLDHRQIKQANLSNAISRLELIEFNSGLQNIDSCESNSNLEPGFFKIGYTTDNLDKLLAQLDNVGIQSIGKIVNDPISLDRMIIIKDPDGNRIQFLENTTMNPEH